MFFMGQINVLKVFSFSTPSFFIPTPPQKNSNNFYHIPILAFSLSLTLSPELSQPLHFLSSLQIRFFFNFEQLHEKFVFVMYRNLVSVMYKNQTLWKLTFYKSLNTSGKFVIWKKKSLRRGWEKKSSVSNHTLFWQKKNILYLSARSTKINSVCSCFCCVILLLRVLFVKK